jgi:acetoin utilization protein AcuB
MIPRQVKDWMVPTPITVSPTATVAGAQALLETHRIRHLPVMDGDRLVGVITDRDILLASMPRPRKALAHPDALLQLVRVDQVMTRDPILVAPRTPIEEAAPLMLDRRFGALPVTEGGRLVGIISQGDLLKALLALLNTGGAGRQPS